MTASSWLGPLDEHGYARVDDLLTDDEAAELAAAFDDDRRYRSRVQMSAPSKVTLLQFWLPGW